MDMYVISLFFHIYHDLLFGRQGSFFLLAHLELRYGSPISEFSAIHNELNLSFFIGGPLLNYVCTSITQPDFIENLAASLF